eukprot:GHVQ01026482.1.p1 GENE.GHVQ01026482.1~~GHVQ01026482.1.p1  ORF type:complete len:507 (-),score=97.66 GHVQ01026482.1:381-1790(-)
MPARNPNFSHLQSGYLFVEISNRKQHFLSTHPTAAKLISLGIGDTTEALPSPIVNGYPDYNGDERLRQSLSELMYNGCVDKDEIFISDGSKPDLGRLQFLFDSDSTTIAVQDPVYPVYVDSAVISGKGGKYIPGSRTRYSTITYMPCTPENNFFPNLNNLQRTDLIYFCSPNNPTGTCASRDQLEQLVKFAAKNNSIIIYDSAYREFISDPSIPKSIYEIDGAKEVALETCSFSKLIGFTGVRLGWTVCPKLLKFKCGSPVWNDWSRIMGTIFNGPSNLAEAGGMAALTPEGLVSMRSLISYYMANVKLIKPILDRAGLSTYGGIHSPYMWIKVPDSFLPHHHHQTNNNITTNTNTTTTTDNNHTIEQSNHSTDKNNTSVVNGGGGGGDKTERGSGRAAPRGGGQEWGSVSWCMFQALLDNCSLVCTPGAGFGEGGEGYVRFSMFAHKENVVEAAERLEKYLSKFAKTS